MNDASKIKPCITCKLKSNCALRDCVGEYCVFYTVDDGKPWTDR